MGQSQSKGAGHAFAAQPGCVGILPLFWLLNRTVTACVNSLLHQRAHEKRKHKTLTTFVTV
jgi:hypothetical protein